MTTRQSSRLKALPKVDEGEFKYVDSSGDESDSAVAGPSTKVGSKRKRKSKDSPSAGTKGKAVATSSATLLGVKDDSGRPTKKFRGKRGFLQQIAEMPLELLFEIFGKLDPIDVLHLSRTTKSLRAILMQKSSADIWKASLENVPDLPPAPEDLDEPRWVDLLFGKNCHVCGRTTSFTTQTYAWEARLRGCSKCVLAEFTFTRSVWSDYVPTFQLTGSARRSERGLRFYSKASQVLDDSYNALETSEERVAWIAEQSAAKKVLGDHAKLCSRWLASQRDARSDALEEIRSTRKEVLRQKIDGMGYNPTLVELTFEEPSFWTSNCVGSILKKDISDRVWAAMEGAFITLMDGFKDKLAKQQRNQSIKKRFDVFLEAYREYVDTRPMDEPLLTAADLFQASGVKEIVLTEPIDDDLEPAILEELVISKITELQEEWVKASKAKVVAKMKEGITPATGLDKEAADESTLELAVALFKCKLCYNDGISGVNLLLHACSRDLRGRFVPETLDEDMRTFISHTKSLPWNLYDSFSLSDKAAKTADIIKTKLDLDPAALTVKALDELDPIFEHVNGTTGGRSMYSWRGLVGRPSHLSADLTTTVLIKDEETKACIRDRLDEAMRKSRADIYHGGEHLHCTRCRKFKSISSARLRSHLKESHGVENITNEDVWIHPDELGAGRHLITYYKHPGVTVI